MVWDAPMSQENGPLLDEHDDLGEDLEGVLHVFERAVLVVAVVDARLTIATDLQIEASLLHVAD